MEPTERRVLEMAAVVGETCWLDAIIALERSAQPGSPIPTARRSRRSRQSAITAALAVVAAIGKLVEREWLVEVPQSSVAGRARAAVRVSEPVVRSSTRRPRTRGAARYHAIGRALARAAPRGPRARRRRKRSAATSRSPAMPARPRRATAAPPRPRARSSQNERAIRLYDRALACIGDHDVAARIHLWHDLGSIYELIGDFEAALGAFERMLRLSWVAASKTKAAVAFNKMGRVWRRKGDLKLALEYLERGLELFRGASDARGIAGSLDDIGKTLQMLGRYDEAHAKITEALARRGKRGDKRAIATSLSRLGDVQQDRGQYESAYTCHKEALELRKAGRRSLGPGRVAEQPRGARVRARRAGRGARGLARRAARGRGDRRAAAVRR